LFLVCGIRSHKLDILKSYLRKYAEKESDRAYSNEDVSTTLTKIQKKLNEMDTKIDNIKKAVVRDDTTTSPSLANQTLYPIPIPPDRTPAPNPPAWVLNKSVPYGKTCGKVDGYSFTKDIPVILQNYPYLESVYEISGINRCRIGILNFYELNCRRRLSGSSTTSGTIGIPNWYDTGRSGFETSSIYRRQVTTKPPFTNKIYDQFQVIAKNILPLKKNSTWSVNAFGSTFYIVEAVTTDKGKFTVNFEIDQGGNIIGSTAIIRKGTIDETMYPRVD